MKSAFPMMDFKESFALAESRADPSVSPFPSERGG
jgi:hypothetical protein